MVLTTHYLDEAEQLSDRAGIIAAGKLVEIGDITTIGGPASRTPRVRWQEPMASGARRRRTRQLSS